MEKLNIRIYFFCQICYNALRRWDGLSALEVPCRVPLSPNTRMETVYFIKNWMANKRFTSLAARLLIVAAAIMLLGSNGTERDNYRSDVLTFLGDRVVSADSLPGDSFLVTLDRKTATPNTTPSKYSIILRGIDPVERALFQDAQTGRWERFDLFRAAMVAEGIRDIEFIRAQEARLDALVANVLTSFRSSGDTTPQALTRVLFEAMHKELLTQPYDLHCTELSKVMRTGHFNCVSATVLFNCLAEKAGLDVTALEMPGHALSRVKFAGGAFLNIETTCPVWFDLQSEQERRQATLARVSPSLATPNPLMAQNAVPATPEPAVDLASQYREISPVQLVATIYYNSGVDLLAKGKYPEAVAANVKALYLDRNNAQAWTNLLTSINNWVALDVAAEGKKVRLYDLAAFLLDQGVALDASFEKFRGNYTYVFGHWIHDLARLGRFDDARKVFSIANAPERIPNDKYLLTLMEGVNQAEKELGKGHVQK